MTEEKLLDIEEEPTIDRQSELDGIESRLQDCEQAVDGAIDDLPKSSNAYSELQEPSRELASMRGEIEDIAQNFAEWQDWGQSWKDLALELIRDHEPERLAEEEDEQEEVLVVRGTTVSKEPIKNNDGKDICQFCGGQTKSIDSGFGSIYNVCTKCGK